MTTHYNGDATHLEELRAEQFFTAFANPKLYVYGNPLQSVIDHMAAVGFWPPAFEGGFKHLQFFREFGRRVPLAD